MTKDPKCIVSVIRKFVQPGTPIRKPKSICTVKGWGERREEPALVYQIRGVRGVHEKGIMESEWVKAFAQLTRTGELTRDWFNDKLVDCRKEGGCNFTTIGGVFELLGVAVFSHRGCYRKS